MYEGQVPAVLLNVLEKASAMGVDLSGLLEKVGVTKGIEKTK